MAIWLILFALTFIASLFMAYRSMSDYYEQASNFSVPYSQYLVGKPDALTPEILRHLHQSAYDGRLIISFERLFKGGRRALVIFGPTTLLHSLVEPLKLTELEDYSKNVNNEEVIKGGVVAWGIGRKNGVSESFQMENIFSSLPELLELEEFWWQVIVQPKDNKDDEHFDSIIRAILITDNSSRAQVLKDEMSKLGQAGGLAELPKSYSTQEFLKLYQERALSKEYTTTIKSAEVSFLVEA